MNWWFVAAAGFTALVMLTHLVLGGREIARPLLAAERLDEVPRYTSYYCWHLVSIMQFGTALAFWVAAVKPVSDYLALFATGSVVLSMTWSLVMIAIFKLRVWHFPQWLLYVPPSVCGVVGLLA